MRSAAVHGTRRRGLAPLGRCQLPLPRASRAKRAGPEAAEVDSGQAMSGEPPCTAQGGEVWHLLATVNFRCLGPRERSERSPRRRKFTVAKRCRRDFLTCLKWLINSAEEDVLDCLLKNGKEENGKELRIAQS
ncbi:hypothetical protein TYRP_006178 [Tyrophagus putrescentiae]|nr:hypothetical protein TYRP_006178 [Tyrophagus putrescentiae]